MKYLFLIAMACSFMQACSNSSEVSSSDQSSKMDEYYSEDDFVTVRKIDAHVHANVDSLIFLKVAEESNFEILSINVDYPDFPAIDVQANISNNLSERLPDRFHFVTTFSMKGFSDDAWTENVIKRIDDSINQGAVGVKVWKNVGMVEKDTDGDRIFLNDMRFSGLLNHLERNGIPLIAHQGEPRNCWLPLEQMTTNNDRLYFSSHPEYYMHLHPEEPRYEELMAVRDEVLGRHDELVVIGAHLASLEWSVDEIAKFLDAHPKAVVDMAARMSEVQNQSNLDYGRVRDFFIKYQDRILYGSDLTHNPLTVEMRQQNPPVTDNFYEQAQEVWKNDWRYLATDKSQHIWALETDSKGIKLPKNVLDKIYYKNAARVFGL